MSNWKLVHVSLIEDTSEPRSSSLFDPSEHSIDEVKQYVTANPDEVQRIYDAEEAGKARKGLLTWLTEE